MGNVDRPPRNEPEGKYSFEEISPIDKEGYAIVQEFIQAQKDHAKTISLDRREEAFDHVFMLLDGKRLADAITKADFDTSSSFLHVFYDNGKPVACGIVGISNENGKLVVLDNFFGVGSEYARQGLATQLLLKQHQKLRQLGITEYVSHARNESALPLYQKLAASELAEGDQFTLEELEVTDFERQYTAQDHMTNLLVRLT